MQGLAQLLVGFLRWNVGIHQHYAECQVGTFLQIRLYEAWPFRRNLARELCVSISRQIGEHDFRSWSARPSHRVKVNAAGATRGGTGARHLGSKQGIDDAGFPYIGAPEKRNL